MSTRSVTHATFSIERTYPAPPAQVFSAWADPEAKARWLLSRSGEHELDFREGGLERIRARLDSGTELTFESVYRDIVRDERIVYASTMAADGNVTTLSITTVELNAVADGTRLLLVEQGTYLDGHEQPEWRERGTADQLEALGTQLAERTNA